jgi:hypothetical protein
MVSGTTTLSSSAIYDWTMRDRNTGWQRLQRRSVHRALRQVAEPIGRADTPGQPILWRLRRPRRMRLPRRPIEIIGEIAKWPILPMLQTMSRAPFHGFCARHETQLKTFYRERVEHCVVRRHGKGVAAS